MFDSSTYIVTASYEQYDKFVIERGSISSIDDNKQINVGVSYKDNNNEWQVQREYFGVIEKQKTGSITVTQSQLANFKSTNNLNYDPILSVTTDEDKYISGESTYVTITIYSHNHS